MGLKRIFLILSLLSAPLALAQTQTGGGGVSGNTVNGSPVSNGIYVTTSDILWFQWTGQNAATIFHTFRIQTATCGTGVATGAIYDAVAQGTSWSTTYTASTAGGQGTGKVFPVCGWLISASSVITSSGTLGCVYGQGFLLSSMPTGGNTATSVSTFVPGTSGGTLLFGGNASSFYMVGWSVGGGTLVQSSLLGPGCQGNQNPSNPSAGADLAATQITDGATGTPPTHRIQLIAVHFRLVTSASAASRIPCILLGTSGLGTTLTTVCAAGTQAASQTVDYDFFPGAGTSCPTALITGTNCVEPIPFPYFLQGVDSFIKTSTTGIQAADQISNVWIKTIYWNEQD